MLGRLKMTVDECIEKYKGFMKKVFNAGIFGKKGHFIIHQEFYDAGVLEGVIKDLIRERIGKDDAELLNEADPCKMYRHLSRPTPLRTVADVLTINST